MSEAILTSAPPPADWRIAYGDHPLQFGDLRLPTGAGPHPLAIFVHGGYWRARYDLAYFGHCCTDLARRGIATWNIEYRRLGDVGGGWPGTFVDVGHAIDYVRTLAKQHSIDINNAVLVGHSAGGHLALWAAGRQRLPIGSEIGCADPLAVRAVVALAPVADLRMAWDLRLSDGVTSEFIGGPPEQYPARYAQASPAELVPLGVRQIIVHGMNDTPVPFAVGRSYAELARAAGDTVDLLALPATGHFEIVDPATPQWQQIAEAIYAELRRAS
jgi:acetyl esterase/lipase